MSIKELLRDRKWVVFTLSFFHRLVALQNQLQNMQIKFMNQIRTSLRDYRKKLDDTLQVSDYHSMAMVDSNFARLTWSCSHAHCQTFILSPSGCGNLTPNLSGPSSFSLMEGIIVLRRLKISAKDWKNWLRYGQLDMVRGYTACLVVWGRGLRKLSLASYR